jgi:outer membrane protein assembly factor BamA
MKSAARMGLLAAALTGGAAMAAGVASAPSYTLNGYSFGGMPGVNTLELEAKLKQKEGARITRADVAADQAILVKELQARHIKGQLFASIAERHGRVWVIFDLQEPDRPTARFEKLARRLESQNFAGASRISASALAAATGLKQGDPLSPEKINAARQAIVAAYAKTMSGNVVSIKGNAS